MKKFELTSTKIVEVTLDESKITEKDLRRLTKNGSIEELYRSLSLSNNPDDIVTGKNILFLGVNDVSEDLSHLDIEIEVTYMDETCEGEI
jgi:hypothetical protein